MTVYSQNGYVADDSALISTYLIPGTETSISMRDGSVSVALRYVAHRIDQEVQNIDGGIHDDWGYSPRPIRGQTSVLSNHASGTAIDLNATKHARQSSNRYDGYNSAQVQQIHRILADCDGVVRWGGDYVDKPYDPMHFEINRSISYVQALAAKITAGQKPGAWVGFPGPEPVEDPVPTRTSVTGGAVPGVLTPNAWHYLSFDMPGEDGPHPSVLSACEYSGQAEAALSGVTPDGLVVMQFVVVKSGGEYPITKALRGFQFHGVTLAYVTEAGGIVESGCLLRARIAVTDLAVSITGTSFRSLSWKD